MSPNRTGKNRSPEKGIGMFRQRSNLFVSPDDDPGSVGLVLGEIFLKFATDLGPEDRRDATN